jgi:G:T-mismatch repair DNA endonuclease (very short patch repair protein)
MLQQIIKTYKKKSWLRLCTLHNINKWDLIDYLNVPFYNSRYLIKNGLEVLTRSCLNCGAGLNLGIYKETFIAKITCSCARDNTNLMTVDKLRTVLSEDQANLAITLVNSQKKTGLPNTVEFWLNKGLTLEQAHQEIIKVQTTRSLNSPASKKGARIYSTRTVEYWITRGLSPEAAISKVKEVQTTNGLAYYKNKYGDCGEALFNARIEKWLNSAGNKNMIANRSKKSIELFEKIGIGEYGPNEKTVRGKQKVHRVDFLYEKKIIEFYGDYWHGNPVLYGTNAMIRKKKITDVWTHDATKVKDLEDNGYSVMIIWESDYKSSPIEILQKCKDFIK